MFVVSLLAVAGAYAVFVAVRLGIHQRLPLAFGRISLEQIPDRAAKAHGQRTLFTTDTPVRWGVPALRQLYGDDRAWSATRIRSTAGYLARALQERVQIGRGDRVAILKENHLDIHILIAAIVRAGGVACPVNGKFAADKVFPYLLNVGAGVVISDVATLLRILRQKGRFGRARTIIVAEKRELVDASDRLELETMLAATEDESIRLEFIEDLLGTVAGELAAIPRHGSEPLYLVHSSGTTGFPKAVILENGAQSHAVRGWLCYVHLSRSRDRGFVAVPNNHQAVILTFNSALLLGLPGHWTAAYDRDDFDAERVVEELARGGYTGFFGFPIVYTLLKEVTLESYDLSRMRFWASTADAAHEAVQRRVVAVGGAFRSFGLPVTGSVYLDAQGSSEVGTPSVIRYVSTFTKKFGRRIGRPGSTPFGPRVRVVTSDGAPVRPGKAGRLEVKGRTLFGGYWNNHPLTYAVMRDGWFFTGDIVRRGDDGHLVQLDREVDVIHTRSGPVYSLPIEEVLHKHPAVFDVCVYGARQEDGSQLPVAAVALRQSPLIDAESLRREFNAELPEHDRLWRVDIVRWADFPIGITGKTLKRVFRERTERGEIEEQNRPESIATAS